MPTSLLGIHDVEAAGATPQGTWILDTLALSESPQPRDYRHAANGLNVIVRANWGYGSTGTLPVPSRYGEYVDELSTYVAVSKGCHRWIIGNEPNLSREWPDGQPIMPLDYAVCYSAAREAIHALPGHERDEVLVAGSGPWNDDLRYAGNERGDWVQYTLDCLRPLGTDCEGVALHAYCHGYDPTLASSIGRMDYPFDDRYYNFLCFTDYLRAFPAILSAANYYITESNGDGPWQATGLIPAMLQQVDDWNRYGAFLVRCLICYRFPAYDQFYMQGKADVMAEYVSSTHLYTSPSFGPVPPIRPEPPPDTGESGGGSGEPPRNIDPRLIARGVTLMTASVIPGTQYWRVTKAEWFNEQEAQGRHNTFVTLLDENGQLVTGELVMWYWQSGFEDKPSEIKHDPWLGHDYSCDFPMYNVAPSYGVKIANWPTDDVWGLGLGSIEQPDYKIHTAYSFTFQLVTATEPESIPPIPPLPPVRSRLIWPVFGPITQAFGEGGPQWNMPGHDGIDVACVENTPVCAIDDGEVVYIDFDVNYGNYCRIWHKSICSYAFFAHLNAVQVEMGQQVTQGQTVALSGNTGSSTGPHLHFEMRGCDETGEYVDVTAGYFNGRYNPADAYLVTGSPVTPA